MKKAVLIFKRHQTVIEDEYEQKTMSIPHFISTHDKIDAETKKEKTKRNFIHWIFLIVDIVFTLLIFTGLAIIN